MDTHLDWDHPPEIAEVRRWMLLAAGRHVIERQGLHSFTIEDITREARLAKGTFYNYFASREDFLDELRAALAIDLAASVRTAAEGPWDGIFVRVMSTVVKWLVANPALRGLFSAAYLVRPDRPTRDQLLSLTVQILHDGVQAGVFKAFDRDGTEGLSEVATQLVYDALYAGTARAAAAFPDASAIEATDELLRRALRFDGAAGRRQGWASPTT